MKLYPIDSVLMEERECPICHKILQVKETYDLNGRLIRFFVCNNLTCEFGEEMEVDGGKRTVVEFRDR